MAGKTPAMMRSFPVVFLLLAGTAFAVPPPGDVCDLLSTTSLEQAQNGKFFAAHPTSHDDGSFTSSLCFYKLQPESRSVSLEVISHSAKDHFSPREFWRKKFHPSEEEATEKENAFESTESARESAERKNKRPPQHLAGIGEDAFWVDTGRDGALYVLAGDSILRLSLGGRDPQSVKAKKASALARSVVAEIHARSSSPTN